MATIRDVAALAGVSTTTVSRVLNAKQAQIPISETTRRKVIAAAKELGYEPNFMARSLAGRRTDTLGLVMYDLAHVLHPNFSQIVHGIATALSESPFDLMLLPLKGKLKADKPIPFSIASYYRQRRVDGLIVAAQEASTEDVLELRRVGCPFVLLGAHVPNTDLPSVRADVAKGMASLVTHLLELGHRRIALINGPRGFRINDEMAAGYRQALDMQGVRADGRLVTSDFTSEATRACASTLLDLSDRPTAIIAADDVMAVDVLHVAGEAGLSVPRDLSVAGFADLPVATGVHPALTTVRIPIAETGRRAGELLLNLLEDAEGLDLQQVLPSELIVRESTAKVLPRSRRRMSS